MVLFSNGRPEAKITGHLNSEQVKVCFSEVTLFQIFVIQIPTVGNIFDIFLDVAS